MSRRGKPGMGMGRGFGAVQPDRNHFPHRTETGPVTNGANGNASNPPLVNFFSFTSMALPTIQTNQFPNEHVAEIKRDGQRLVEDDNNTDYVEKHKAAAEKTALITRQKNLQNQKWAEEKVMQTAASSANGDFDASVLGTVLPKGQLQDDADVFWKYDMSKRLQGTENLQINSQKIAIRNLLHSRQVLIVEGFTGCGKTTQVPQFILDEAALNKTKCRIVVTQPRRIAAISIANRVCNERGWEVGTLVGYQVGMDKKFTDDTRLTFVTTGVLLQLLIASKTLNNYTHIIIDEVHERDLETDLLLLVIKKLLMDQGGACATKILLMSATLNAPKFLDYFPNWGEIDLYQSAIVTVVQPAVHKISEYYLDTLAVEYGFEGFSLDGSEEPKVYSECYEIASKIIEGFDFYESTDTKFFSEAPVEVREKFEAEKAFQQNRGAVLIFLPGLAEIDTMFKQLNELPTGPAGNTLRADQMKWTTLPLHSSITSEEQQRVFLSAKSGYRKIILATNIAESSITVPDIKYVIDFCLTKSLSCDPTTNYTCLRLEWASKNQCIQRRGRCGRVSAGHVYRMVPLKFFNLLAQDALPEMEKASLESVVLHVKNLNMGSPSEILALAVDPPKLSGIGRAVSNLKEVGALTLKVGNTYDKYDGDLTYMGEVMSRLPIDIRFGRLVMLGYVFGVLDEAIVIAAGLSTKSPFSNPFARRLDAYLSKLGWAVFTYSDCFAILNAFSSWHMRHKDGSFRNYGEERNWSRTYFLQISVLREVGALVDEIKKRLKMAGIAPIHTQLTNMERGLVLKLVIAGAFYPNYFVRARPNKKEYEKDISRDVGGFNPLNSVVFQGFPIEQPGKLYAKHISDALTSHKSIPHIEFHASRVIVTFDPRGDKIGPISHGVYRALKMRLLRQRLNFYTAGREEAVKALECGMDRCRVNSLVAIPVTDNLPSIQESEFSCFVTHPDSADGFWVIRNSDEWKMSSIEDALNNPSENLLPMRKEDIVVGNMCIAIKDSNRLRARIECVLGVNEVLLFIIDHGMSIWRPMSQVFKFSKTMMNAKVHTHAGLAIKCRLSEVKAPTRNGCVWYDEVRKEFREFIQAAENMFVLKVYSVVDSEVAGVLYSTKLQESFNERLILKTYADRRTEPRISYENNEARRMWKPLRYDSNMIKAYDEKQICGWAPQRLLDPPELSPEFGCLVTLRGPHSPLEMTFASLSRSAHLKVVQVEGSSVNCIALDQEPYEGNSRVLVAANVGIAQRSGNIMARETTMMPAIPGLVALLTMVFCPKLEFRTDDLGTRYTGLISGLGIDPVEGGSIYPDHDMEIIFDTTIEDEDIHIANSIRTTMNLLLRPSASKYESAENLREKARTELISLLQRNRAPMEEVWPDVVHSWVISAEETILANSNIDTELRETDVFPLHATLKLNPDAAVGLAPQIPRNVFQS